MISMIKAGTVILYDDIYHNDQGTREDPTGLFAILRKPDGTFVNLTAPTKLNAQLGWFGGTFDTTGLPIGVYSIVRGGTVTTSKSVATSTTFQIIANDSADVMARVGAPTGVSISADIQTRLATSGYTAPDNARIVAINDKVSTLDNPDNIGIADIKTKVLTLDNPDNIGITAIGDKVATLVNPDNTAISNILDKVATLVNPDNTAISNILDKVNLLTNPDNATLVQVFDIVSAIQSDIGDPSVDTTTLYARLLALADAVSNISTTGGGGDPLAQQLDGYPSGTAGYVLKNIGNLRVQFVSPIADNGDITIVRGDDYFAADGRALLFTDVNNKLADLTGATIALVVGTNVIGGSIIKATGTDKQVQIEMSSADTSLFTASRYEYKVRITYANGHKTTLAMGKANIL